MADSSEPPAAETPSQRQARIRKEKREAKIRDGGSARLNKIIGLGGGLPRGVCLQIFFALMLSPPKSGCDIS